MIHTILMMLILGALIFYPLDKSGLLSLEKEVFLTSQPYKVYFSKNGGEDFVKVKIKSYPDEKNIVFLPNEENFLAFGKGKIFQEEREGGFLFAKISFKKIPSEIKLEKIKGVFWDREIFNKLYIIGEKERKSALFVSFDRGESVEVLYEMPFPERITAFSQDPFSLNILYLGTSKGNFLVSNNWGRTWKKEKSFERKIKKIEIDEDGKIYLLLERKKASLFSMPSPWSQDQPTEILVSEDKGKSFKVFYKTFGKIKDFKVIKNEIILIEDGKLFKLKNSQKEKFPLPLEEKVFSFDVSPSFPELLYIGGRNFLLKSEDGGKSFESVFLPQKGVVSQIQIHPQNPEIVLIFLR